MITYLQSQIHRMNDQQKNLVERLIGLHEDQWQKKERERLSVLYLWLHMYPGSVANRKFSSRSKRR